MNSMMSSDETLPSIAEAYESFFSTIKSSMAELYAVRMVYMTGILPVLLSEFFSSWNVVSIKTFDPKFAELFGLTSSDISEALDSITVKDENKKSYLNELTYYANGYRFTPDPMEEPVFNPETALQYLNASYASCQ